MDLAGLLKTDVGFLQTKHWRLTGVSGGHMAQVHQILLGSMASCRKTCWFLQLGASVTAVRTHTGRLPQHLQPMFTYVLLSRYEQHEH